MAQVQLKDKDIDRMPDWVKSQLQEEKPEPKPRPPESPKPPMFKGTRPIEQPDTYRTQSRGQSDLLGIVIGLLIGILILQVVVSFLLLQLLNR